MESFLTSKEGNAISEVEFFDEPMDTSETIYQSYWEEGEIKSSDDDLDMRERGTRSVVSSSIFSIKAKNISKQEGFIGGPDIFDEEEDLKKLIRAKRFSIPIKSNHPTGSHQEELVNLYRDLGIDKENERHYRFNAIHLRGAQNMKTEDVVKYFESYTPIRVEWVNNDSCNVVWSDDVSAAEVLLNMTKKIKNLDRVCLNADTFQMDFTKKTSNVTDEFDDESIDARKINAAIPPGFWRIGRPSIKSPCLFFRFATRSDKKISELEKSSDCNDKEYENLPGLISRSRRIQMKKSINKFFDSDSRIYCDDRNQQNMMQSSNRNNPWKDLAYEWGKVDKVEKVDYPEIKSDRFRSPISKRNVPDLRISLRIKKEKHKRLKDLESRGNLSDKWDERIKVPRMKMYADDEEERLEKSCEKRSQKNSVGVKPIVDLRSKINKKKKRERFKLRSERKQRVEMRSTESSSSDSEFGDDSEAWALENYRDLRHSLTSSKKQNYKLSDSDKCDSENDNCDDSEFFHEVNIGQRSPLQIEIDNDEYYQNRSSKR